MRYIPVHGGNIYKFSEILKCEPSDILDFSANINPFGMPPGLKANFIHVLDVCVNYPDPESIKLKAQLANYLKLKNTNVCVGSGALDIINLIFKTLDIKKILIPAPTFIEYEKSARREDIEVYLYKREESDGFKLDFDRLLEVLIKNNCDSIILCNPNNPTSTIDKASDILNFVKTCSSKGIIVIIDEAFIELTKKISDYTVAEFIEDSSNLYVIRAFTKFFAIPGIRMGYCVASEENIKRLEANQPSWPINTLASEVGIVFETDKEYIRNTNEWLDNELDYLYNNLCDIEAIKVYKPNTNFILCKLIADEWDSQKLAKVLLKNKILIRDASNFTYLNNKFFRLAVKDRESNNILLEALSNINWR